MSLTTTGSDLEPTGLRQTEEGRANEMKRYKLSIVAVTETHLAAEGEMPLDEEGK